MDVQYNPNNTSYFEKIHFVFFPKREKMMHIIQITENNIIVNNIFFK